jgi:hypothetical protein
MSEETTIRPKDPYEAPGLRELGDVDALTAGIPGDSVTDFDDN